MKAAAGDRDAKMLEQLRRAGAACGVQAELKAAGHFHLRGALLVNYWPFAAARTAYVANTTKSMRDVTPKAAIELAQKLPDLVPSFKRKKYRNAKLRMLKKDPRCHWCKCDLVDETATVDHEIPLSRGGLDNDNNRVLACAPCNCERGNSMPEKEFSK